MNNSTGSLFSFVLLIYYILQRNSANYQKKNPNEKIW